MTELSNFVMNHWEVLAGICVVFWIYKCVNIVQPNEMAIRVTLGSPAEKGKDSGLVLIIWPLQTLWRYTKILLEFKFRTWSIMSKRGKVAGYDNKIETAEINVDCTVFAQFDINNLKKTAENAPGRTVDDLGPFLVPYCNDTVRALGGRIPWRLLNQERLYSSEWVLARLKGGVYHEIDDGDENKHIMFATERFDKDGNEIKARTQEITVEDLEKSSPFVQFGLKNVNFTIEDVNFTNKELQDAVSAPETARLQADATILTAGGEQIRLEHEGMGKAMARNAMLKVIKEFPDLEALKTLREMAQGPSNTIFQLPSALENQIKKVLGGNSPQNFLNMMSEADKSALISELSEEIAKLSK